jgi:hypothetical protein
MTSVLVTGGTGVLGREVVSRLLETGYPVRIMSRSPRRGTPNVEWAQAQLLTGEGLSEALQGVDVSLSSSLALRHLPCLDGMAFEQVYYRVPLICLSGVSCDDTFPSFSVSSSWLSDYRFAARRSQSHTGCHGRTPSVQLPALRQLIIARSLTLYAHATRSAARWLFSSTCPPRSPLPLP